MQTGSTSPNPVTLVTISINRRLSVLSAQEITSENHSFVMDVFLLLIAEFASICTWLLQLINGVMKTFCHLFQSQVLAVIDWEAASWGHPFEDLAYFCFPYHFPEEIDVIPGFKIGRSMSVT